MRLVGNDWMSSFATFGLRLLIHLPRQCFGSNVYIYDSSTVQPEHKIACDFELVAGQRRSPYSEARSLRKRQLNSVTSMETRRLKSLHWLRRESLLA